MWGLISADRSNCIVSAAAKAKRRPLVERKPDPKQGPAREEKVPFQGI